jgi:WD40 repeat protein
MVELYRYAAFISYTSENSRFARRLHRALETYRIPAGIGVVDLAGKPNRIAPVFIDREELPSGHLGELIEAALRASSALIVVCSRQAVASLWVSKEIAYFITLQRSGRIFAIVADEETDDIDNVAGIFFPEPLLKESAGTDVLAADARAGRDGFQNAMLKLVAGIIQVGLGDLVDRDRRARRQRRILVGAGIGMALFLGATGFGIYDNNAMQQAMGTASEELVRDGQPIEAISLALAAARDRSDAAHFLSSFEADQWLLQTGAAVRVLLDLRREFSVSEHAIVPDGSRILVKDERDIASIWDAREGKRLSVIGPVTSWGLSESGTIATIRHKDDSSSIWNLTTGKQLGSRTAPGTAQTVYHNKVSDVFVTISDRFSCVLWNAHTGDPIARLPDDCDAANASDKSGLIVTRSIAKMGKLWTTEGQPVAEFQEKCLACNVSKSGTVAFAIDGTKGHIYHLKGQSIIESFPIEVPSGANGIFSDDSAFLVTRDSFNRQILWDTRDGRQIADLGVWSANNWRFSPDSARLLAWRSDDSGILWESSTGRLLKEFGAGELGSVSMSNRGSLMAVKTHSGRGIVWELASGQVKYALPGNLSDVRLSDDGTRLAASSDNEPGYLWDVTSQKKLGDFDNVGEDSGPQSKFSPDSSRYVTHDHELGAALWDARSGQFVAALGGPGSVGEVRISLAGDTVLTVSAGYRGVVWDTSSAQGKLQGADLRERVCSINDRFGSLAHARSQGSAKVRHYLTGRPWHPCDWKGLLTGEGWLQMVRLWGVRMRLVDDYACGAVSAWGTRNARRVEQCDQEMVSTPSKKEAGLR